MPRCPDDPLVSVIILNWNHPEQIDRCLHSLEVTADVPYEVVVVDNASTDGRDALNQHLNEGRIDRLIFSPINYFYAGNNLGVARSNQASEYVTLVNSDVEFIHPQWLAKMVAWMEGASDYVGLGSHPTVVPPGPRDIVSFGWAYDAEVEPGHARPEGFCITFRRGVYQPIDLDFPWHYGLEKMMGDAIRAGAKCGVLAKYSPYLIHHEHGSWDGHSAIAVNPDAVPDVPGWLSGLDIATLDFTLGPDEYESYLTW